MDADTMLAAMVIVIAIAAVIYGAWLFLSSAFGDDTTSLALRTVSGLLICGGLVAIAFTAS